MLINPVDILETVGGQDPIVVAIVLSSVLISLWLHSNTIERIFLEGFFENLHIIGKIIALFIGSYAALAPGESGVRFYMSYVFGFFVISAAMLAIHIQTAEL